jgi:hypothetical protein
MRSTEIPEASPYAPSQGAGERNSSYSKPSRPIGVISPKALKGEPHPLPYYTIVQAVTLMIVFHDLRRRLGRTATYVGCAQRQRSDSL